MTIAINDIGNVKAIFADVEQQIASVDYRPVLEVFQSDIASGEALTFAAQSTPDGDAWPALAPSTVKRKGNSKILFATGSLMASLVNVGGEGNVHSVDSRQLVFGTDVKYAVFHETGTAKFPQCFFVGISDETLQSLVEKIADATVEQMKGSRRES